MASRFSTTCPFVYNILTLITKNRMKKYLVYFTKVFVFCALGASLR